MVGNFGAGRGEKQGGKENRNLMKSEIQVRVLERSDAEEAARRQGVRAWWKDGTAIAVGIAVGTVVVHVATGARYGFDRDELMLLEDARHLAWGYVAYPPMTAFFVRVALELFGTSLVGFRFFAALVQAVALVLTGLMAKEMGGGRWAQVVAALAGAPFCLGAGALMQYISFDYVCWVWVAYCVVRLLGGGEVRWWIGIGAGIGLGMMAKYTMAFLAVGVVVGVLLTDVRRHWKSKWLWTGAGVALVILLPNLIWQTRRNFVSLEFLRFLHERDVGTGVTDWFLAEQLELTLMAFPLAAAGLWFCLFSDEGKRYRMVGWMYAMPLALFLVMRGRDYYLAPAYPMLYAAGAAWVEKWMIRQREASKEAKKQGSQGVSEAGPDANADTRTRWIRSAIWAVLAVDVVVAGAVALPLAPVNSAWWKFAAKVDVVFPEEIGWPEFVETVAQVRDQLPASERGGLGVLAGNYGELGALNLYGEKYALPRAISGVNSSWERGYGLPAPETLIVVGFQRDFLEKHFASCELAARTWNRYGVANEETVEDPDIFVCQGLRGGWEAFWKEVRGFA